ncbi:hypothetical protein A5780_25150 [Nocardia sp. 852002-20019_SCH5090214]|uniref:hypothetical protein n=1 Tax=Nocardia sp. 852002-20019_SCH5090214 TaxID=1834087 RepID=UPI0007EA3DB1|nr:hypothetical protein [Nocardia sp. 852002-20019_SCH5090214]OBA55810.1 hypothetical protein A5780_25150 [Nocardia sp. 852002-20019_SCH5090214]
MVKSGTRLRSQVCSTEVIVVRAGDNATELRCGGAPMVDLDRPRESGASPAAEFSGGTLIGKRYVDAEGTIEVLVTKPGEGSLSLSDTALSVKTAKPLPASD